jgi:hypothetical protein
VISQTHKPPPDRTRQLRETSIPPAEIRTRNPRKRAGADPRLRPLGSVVTTHKHSRYRPKLTYGVDRGIALPFRDLGARRGWVVSTTPRPLYPRERPGTHCTGGWVGPRACMDVCEKSHPHRTTHMEYYLLINSIQRPLRGHPTNSSIHPAL